MRMIAKAMDMFFRPHFSTSINVGISVFLKQVHTCHKNMKKHETLKIKPWKSLVISKSEILQLAKSAFLIATS